MKIEQLQKAVECRRVFIQTHNFPDPDAIASAFGLQRLLKIFGTDSTICYKGKLDKLATSRMTSLLGIDMVNIDDIPDMKPEDAIITVDAQKYNQNITDFIGDEVACIDHHPTFVPCEYKYSDIRKTGACSSIVTEYYEESGTKIPADVATALTFGIKSDTADFCRAVTEFDIEMFGILFPLVDSAVMAKLQTDTMEFSDLRAYGAAIENIKVYDNVGVAFIPFDCPDALIAMVSDFILALDVIEFSIVYSQRQDGWKFSVRSELKGLDAGAIIRRALDGIGNGGGHAAFAGGFVPSEALKSLRDNPHQQIRERFLAEINGK